MSVTQSSLIWIESLASQQNEVSSGKRPAVELYHAKERLLAVESFTFLNELLTAFEKLREHFNAHLNAMAEDSSLKVKHESASSFSILCGEHCLNLNNSQPGTIQVQCSKGIDGNSRNRVAMFGGSLEAQSGAFYDLNWFYLGSPITADQAARYFITELIQLSLRQDESRHPAFEDSQQVLW